MASQSNSDGKPLIQASGSHFQHYSSTSNDSSISRTASHTLSQPPPGYALYSASAQEIRKNGDTISHDAHLNHDGEALARFLLQQTEQPPSIRILCKGMRNESTSHTRLSGDGSVSTVADDSSGEVVDFSFIISVPVPLSHDGEVGNRPVLWSVGDREPVFRGRSHRQIDAHNGRHAATTEDTRRWREVRETRRNKGLPPWGGQGAWKSSKSLREWADDYCRDPEDGLKEFVFEKVVHGWDIQRLEESIHSVIHEAGYWSGDINVSISTYASRVIIRPNSYSSTLVANYISDTSMCEYVVQAIAALIIFFLLFFILASIAFGPIRPIFAASSAWSVTTDLRPKVHEVPLLLFAGLLLFLMLFIIGGCLVNKLVAKGTRRWSVCGAAYSMVTNEGPIISQESSKPTPGSSTEMILGSDQDTWLAHWKPALKSGVRRGLVFSEVLQSPDPLLR